MGGGSIDTPRPFSLSLVLCGPTRLNYFWEAGAGEGEVLCLGCWRRGFFLCWFRGLRLVFMPCCGGRRVLEQSSLNPAASGAGRAPPMSDSGYCKGKERKDKRRNPYAPTCDCLVHCAASQLFSLAEFGFFPRPLPTGEKLTGCNRLLQLLPGPHENKCLFPVLPPPAPRGAALLRDTL